MANIVLECNTHEPLPYQVTGLANEVQDGRGKINVRRGALELAAKTNSADLVDRRTAVRSDNVDIACDVSLTGSGELRIGEEREDEHVFTLRDRMGFGETGNRIGRRLPLPLPIGIGCHNQPTAKAINGASRFSVGRQVAVFVAPEAVIGERD